MSEDELIDEIIDTIHESAISPEDACAAHPDLLPKVIQKWSRLKKLELELDRWFPNDDNGLASYNPIDQLPDIPGYEVLCELGRGGMGVVFKARNIRLKRHVAIKTMLTGLYSTQAERLRFHREAQSFAAIDHPNIVRLFEFGDIQGDPYFAMELVEGMTLQQQISQSKMSPRESALLICKLARAIQSVHDKGIVHRDLKPSNVLISSIGEPKLTDFGLARSVDVHDSITRIGSPLGTPSYMSPEQAQGQSKNITSSSDIYSLGAILYATLTSRPPFLADTQALLLQQVINADPKPPSRFDVKIPRDLEFICLKCLQKEPRQRYSRALELAEDLERFLAGEAIHAKSEPFYSKIVRRIRRNRVRAAVVSIVAVFGLSVSLFQIQLAIDRARLDAQIREDRQSRETQAVTLLEGARDALETGRWDNAVQSLDSAKAALGAKSTTVWDERFIDFEKWIAMGRELEAIRLSGFSSKDAALSFEDSDKRYRQIFDDTGIGKVSFDFEGFAEKVQASPIRVALVGAIDHWCACTNNESDRSWLLKVVDQIDSSTSDWRREAMSPSVFRDAQVLKRVISRAPGAAISVPLLLAMELRTDATHQERTRYLRAVQQFAPDDFWVNQRLGDVLMHTDKPMEAIGYYQVAVALRGNVAIARNNLALSLLSARRYEEAEQEYSRAVSLEPNLPFIRVAWIRVLHALGRHKEVVAQREIMIGQYPAHAMFRMLLAMSLASEQDSEGANDEYGHAILLEQSNTEIQREYRSFLIRQNKHEEAFQKWSQWAGNSDESHEACYGLAELSLFLNHSQDYEAHRNALLDRFENSKDRYVVERAARTGLLAGTSEAQLARILKMSASVTQLDRKTAGGTYPFFQFLKALSLFRQGKFDDAELILEGDAVNVLRPVPRLIVSMIQANRNDIDAAKSTYAEAEKAYDWSLNMALDQDAWIRHIFRREASQALGSRAMATTPE